MLSVPNVHAALDILADGSDGHLIVTSNRVINLADAATAAWGTRSTNPGKGVYDSNKWAVVFKYSRPSPIAAGATVTFTNHPSRPPVVWLVSGDVTIAGKVDLSGQDAPPPPALAEPGPGDPRGGRLLRGDAQLGGRLRRWRWRRRIRMLTEALGEPMQVPACLGNLRRQIVPRCTVTHS